VKSPDAAPRGCDQEVERSVTVDISETHSVETKRVAWNSAVVGLEQRVDDASSCPAATMTVVSASAAPNADIRPLEIMKLLCARWLFDVYQVLAALTQPISYFFRSGAARRPDRCFGPGGHITSR